MPNPPRLSEPDICPRCGETFDCGKGGKCWCYGRGLSADTRNQLEQQYPSCLCPNCIAELEKKAEKETLDNKN